MAYDHIKRRYGLHFAVGDQVMHTVTRKHGRVMRPKASHLHYVRVHFGTDGAGLCHPQELEKVKP